MQVDTSAETMRAHVALLMGDALLDCGRHRKAFDHYRLVEPIRRTDRLVHCGLRGLAVKSLETGLECFRTAGRAPPSESLAECGTSLLRSGMLGEGQKAYRIACRNIPTQDLIVCGEVAAHNGWFETSIAAFQQAGAVTNLRSLGKQLLEGLKPDLGVIAFSATGTVPESQDIAACLAACWAAGEFRKAVVCCRMLGIDPPQKDLLDCAKAALTKGFLQFAQEAYAAAGLELSTFASIENLLDCARECVRRSWYESAEDAFRLVVERGVTPM